ncbi:hypothetical protein QTL95_17085 [Rhizobium sp. S152]|uniref:hypothetical protein n=1 Tax=Rhizobium sp. S152 TaxID=3055038 RepID=UPI0025A9EE92|nr:hypothetical protein [Rhizobium sp. S152]MDM9627619.1 hypothetical protein [Rhizobium sp. S152]
MIRIAAELNGESGSRPYYFLRTSLMVSRISDPSGISMGRPVAANEAMLSGTASRFTGTTLILNVRTNTARNARHHTANLATGRYCPASAIDMTRIGELHIG